MNNKCNINKFLKKLGFSEHNWKYKTQFLRECKKCKKLERMEDYDGLFETWVEI